MQERQSRLRLMASLLEVGTEMAAVEDSGVQQAMQATWLSSVNNLLAIDQVRGALLCVPRCCVGHFALLPGFWAGCNVWNICRLHLSEVGCS